ncbi:hypothetical protein [Arthrobacter ruber]|uniref:hypothetical protein n=1 Tax=Arthrobacter ruber TaxID=1258893 RepID=UPI000CF494FC|nr:hypothetical protein [Arthrobacter ruber]
MGRDALFFDPLHGTDAPEEPVPASGEGSAPDQGSVNEPPRNRTPDPEELQARRRRELERVQDELRKMARGAARR